MCVLEIIKPSFTHVYFHLFSNKKIAIIHLRKINCTRKHYMDILNGSGKKSIPAKGIDNKALTFKVFCIGNLALVSNTSPCGPDFSRKLGFLTNPHPPLALNIPCINQSDLPYPFNERPAFSIWLRHVLV